MKSGRRRFLAKVCGLLCTPFGVANDPKKPLVFSKVTASEITFPTEHCAGVDEDGGFLVPSEFVYVIANKGFVRLAYKVTGTGGHSLEEVMRIRGVLA